MKRAFIVMLSWIAAATAADNPMQVECQGCHFDARNEPKGYFPSGFGQWNNQQCYGCHAEIIEVATNYNQGKKDQRYFTLPISEERIINMEAKPLPYVEAGSHPWKGVNLLRSNRENLVKFLMRPSGTCNKDGQCAAPKMMAYPNIDQEQGILELLAVSQDHASTQVKDDKQIDRGEYVFHSRCASCHSDSDASGYNASAMSLFSVDWIYNYVNGLVKNQNQRKMPILEINQEDASQLESFFQYARQQAEERVDAKVKEYMTIFETFKPHSMTKRLNQYIWNEFWRDASCVHCHGIEGRAKEAFESTIPGIKKWLQTNEPKEIYERLVTRLAEQEIGMGAKKPGMPMTGAALPPTVVGLIGGWIKNKCPDENGNMHCDVKQNEENTGKATINASQTYLKF